MTNRLFFYTADKECRNSIEKAKIMGDKSKKKERYGKSQNQ